MRKNERAKKKAKRDRISKIQSTSKRVENESQHADEAVMQMIYYVAYELGVNTDQFTTDSLPLGFEFLPTDQNLIEHYLFNKLYNLPYCRAAVFDYDLYGFDEPWQIWDHFGGVDGKDLYFFTKLKRSTNISGQLSAHISRKIGLDGGTWSGENSATPIFATLKDDHIIGYCKRLRYNHHF